MGTPTYTPLANITLGSSAASVTFSSISQAYRDLVLVIDCSTASVAATIVLRLNGDTGSNYNLVSALGDGSSATSSSSASVTGVTVGQGASGRRNLQINFLDYSATDKHKSLVSRHSAAATAVDMRAGRWASTSTVTSVLIYPTASSTFDAGSTFCLYGIAA